MSFERIGKVVDQINKTHIVELFADTDLSTFGATVYNRKRQHIKTVLSSNADGFEKSLIDVHQDIQSKRETQTL